MARVLSHKLEIRHLIGAPDLVELATGRMVLERRDEVVDDVFDRDRLGLTRTQRGVTMTGSFSTSDRTISNEALPEPITIDARSSIVGTPDERRIRPPPVSRRGDRRAHPPPSPPRYTILRTPAATAAAANARRLPGRPRRTGGWSSSSGRGRNRLNAVERRWDGSPGRRRSPATTSVSSATRPRSSSGDVTDTAPDRRAPRASGASDRRRTRLRP